MFINFKKNVPGDGGLGFGGDENKVNKMLIVINTN